MKKSTRAITAIVMFIVMLPFIVLGGYFSFALVAALAAIATFELARVYNNSHKINKAFNYIAPIFSIIILLADLFSGIGSTINYKLMLIVILSIIIAIIIISILYPKFTTEAIMYYIAIIIYVGCGFACTLSIRWSGCEKETLLFNSYNYNLTGVFFIFYILIETQVTDIFAYLVGNKFGKHHFAPAVSPKKTIEGSIGGILFASLFGTIFLTLVTKFYANYPLTPWLILAFVGISILLSVVSEFGDLLASKIKREYDVKDYGNIFPGHGGVMDRFDSFIPVCIIFFIILVTMGVIK